MDDRSTTRPGWLSPVRATLAGVTILCALVIAMAGSFASSASPGSRAGDDLSVAQDVATPVVDDATPGIDCETLAPGTGAEAWVRNELYFGTNDPDGERIPEEEWLAFLDEEITPRFPDGLTVLEGYGQFLSSEGTIIEEDSIVLIIFYPLDAAAEASASIEEIRDEYETQFEQESVLRVDSAPICVSF